MILEVKSRCGSNISPLPPLPTPNLGLAFRTEFSICESHLKKYVERNECLFVYPRRLESLAGCRTMFLFAVSCKISASGHSLLLFSNHLN